MPTKRCTLPGHPDLMALLQIAEPGQSVEPHRHRLAVGIDLGHHQFAGRHGAQQHSGRARRCRGPLAAAVGRALLSGRDGRSRLPGAQAPVRRPAQHGGVGQALHGPRHARRGAHREHALRLRRRARHAAVAHRGRSQEPGRGVGRDPEGAAQARRAGARRRSRRRRDHRPGLLRRRAAPGDQGRGPAGRPQRAAAAERAHRGSGGLRPGPGRRRAPTRSTTSAAARSTCRS